MFIHNFIYNFKILFRNKTLIFWTFAFPIILGTLFSVAFSDIENNEKLDIIDVAIVENKDFKENEMFKEAFEELSDETNEERLFNTKYVTENEAKKLLDEESISGYVLLDEALPKVIVKNSGINETILKFVIEEITQTADIFNKLLEEEINKEIYDIDTELISKKVSQIIENGGSRIENKANSNLSYTVIEFYSLIAMACLYGALVGMTQINNCFPNMSNKGKRVSVSPTSKRKIILSSLLASYIVQLIGLFLLFVYIIFVLKIDFGSNLTLIVLLALIGSFAGLSMGLAIATVVKKGENTKSGIIIAVTMLGVFLSGMMGITMKYVVDTNMPIINKINPASMITDGFYSLYYYDTLDRYLFNIGSLIIFSIIMIILSYSSLRRQKYDSI